MRIPSTTVWLDSDIKSDVCAEPTKITRELSVLRVEYLSALPSYWPVPREATAFVVDLHDPRYDLYDKNGQRLSPDALIKNKVS